MHILVLQSDVLVHSACVDNRMLLSAEYACDWSGLQYEQPSAL